MIFDYEKLYEPYSHELLGRKHTLKHTIDWLKDTTKAEQCIIDIVVANTMQKLSQGEEFETDLDFPNKVIDNYMLFEVYSLMEDINQSKLAILEEQEKTRLEAHMANLVDRDKQLFEAYHGNFWQRNFPTFRRWLGFKD